MLVDLKIDGADGPVKKEVQPKKPHLWVDKGDKIEQTQLNTAQKLSETITELAQTGTQLDEGKEEIVVVNTPKKESSKPSKEETVTVAPAKKESKAPLEVEVAVTPAKTDAGEKKEMKVSPAPKQPEPAEAPKNKPIP